MRLRHGIELDAKDYAGRKSSRSALYGEETECAQQSALYGTQRITLN